MVAKAAIPWRRPEAPNFSLVVAFSPMRRGEMPKIGAKDSFPYATKGIHLRLAEDVGASLYLPTV